MIVQQVAILSENLQQFYSSGDVVDLHRTLLAFTSDTVSHFMIGFSTELQTHSEKAYQWESAMHSLFEMIPITMKFPVLIDLLLKLPESILLTLSPKLAAVLQWRKVSRVPYNTPKYLLLWHAEIRAGILCCCCRKTVQSGH